MYRLCFTTVYNFKLFAILTAIMVFNILDIHFTFINLMYGAEELNPLVKMMIHDNIALFFVYKYFFTLAVLMFAFFFFQKKLIRRLSYLVFTFYGALTVYHILLFFKLSGIYQ